MLFFLRGDVCRQAARILGIIALAGFLGACFPKTEQPVFSSIDAAPFERDATYTAKGAGQGNSTATDTLSFRFVAIDGKDFLLESYTHKKDGKLDASLYSGRLVNVAPNWSILELGDNIGGSERLYVLTKWNNSGFTAYAPLDHKLLSAIAMRHGVVLGSPTLNDGGTLTGALTPSALKAIFSDAAAHIDSGTDPKPAMQLEYISVPRLPDDLALIGRARIFNALTGSFTHRLRAALPEDQKLVMRFMEKLAAAGDPWGSYFLSRIYANGLGVKTDMGEAKAHAENAIARGFDRAKLILGFLLRYTNNPSKEDNEQAFRLFTEAADAGDPTAMVNLALIHLDPNDPHHDVQKGYSWQERAAAAGDANAIYMIGLRLRDGTGTTKSSSEAFKAISVAAQLFHPDAVAELGYMYETGEGTTADDTKAIAQYREAARLGNAWAQWQLGDRLMNGRGVAMDKATGWEWLQKAATNGSTEAAKQLGQSPKPDSELGQIEQLALAFLDGERALTNREFDRQRQATLCAEIGRRCKLNRNGMALVEFQHRSGWYFADGTVAPQQDWPQ
ncbi:sel1 repeat family protein [Pseudaminobacter arsenicus]|uniref:Sel1 repeat family protein n=1 Tax=Borborobacter arsenicus TaxID=1851146 RepID=A0A432V737_9HYPH|nr:tetratricopeptide repeat protein [Pseudaminobacter arsenicus]RUM97994.1 sel1 repeat family protein [Pseudaminobacter arsenicus]